MSERLVIRLLLILGLVMVVFALIHYSLVVVEMQEPLSEPRMPVIITMSTIFFSYALILEFLTFIFLRHADTCPKQTSWFVVMSPFLHTPILIVLGSFQLLDEQATEAMPYISYNRKIGILTGAYVYAVCILIFFCAYPDLFKELKRTRFVRVQRR